MVDLDMQAPRLVGRASELAVLDDFVRGSVSGGGALLLTGDPGVGKSALLDAAVRAAAAHGTRVIRGGGVEYEADVGFAVLHQLLGPLGDHVEELPASRRSALEVALGLASGPAPDRLSVLDAALATFRRAAAAAPLLVVVDDMHWLDEATASVIGFVGRRLADSRVGLLGAARTGAGGFAGGAGWRELVVPALGHEASLDLLGARFAHLPARVRRDVVEEAQGNPLALLEFAAAEGSRLTPGAQCAATVATGAGRAVRRLYDERVARLPADTRLLLLLAALEGSGNLAVLASAGGPGLQALGAGGAGPPRHRRRAGRGAGLPAPDGQDRGGRGVDARRAAHGPRTSGRGVRRTGRATGAPPGGGGRGAVGGGGRGRRGGRGRDPATRRRRRGREQAAAGR